MSAQRRAFTSGPLRIAATAVWCYCVCASSHSLALPSQSFSCGSVRLRRTPTRNSGSFCRTLSCCGRLTSFPLVAFVERLGNHGPHAGLLIITSGVSRAVSCKSHPASPRSGDTLARPPFRNSQSPRGRLLHRRRTLRSNTCLQAGTSRPRNPGRWLSGTIARPRACPS